MPDPEDVNPSPNSSNPQSSGSAGVSPQNQGGGAGSPSQTNDPVKMGEELGKYKKAAEDFEQYKTKVDPVLETIWGDPELYQTVLKKHQKRLGGGADDDPQDAPQSTQNPPAPQSNPVENDNRRTLIGITVSKFEEDHGFQFLPEDSKKDVNQAVMLELADMLDPMGNKKTIQEILADVSPDKLPRFLDKALTLAQKNPKVAQAFESVKSQMSRSNDPGMLGGYGGGSIDSNATSLSEEERRAAQKMGIPEDKYLHWKKVREQNRIVRQR